MTIGVQVIIGIVLFNMGFWIAKVVGKRKNNDESWITLFIKDNEKFDSTVAVICNYGLFFSVIFGLFILDFFVRFVFKDEAGENLHAQPVLTEALIHTIIGFVAGWISNSNKNFFPKMMEKKVEEDPPGNSKDDTQKESAK